MGGCPAPCTEVGANAGIAGRPGRVRARREAADRDGTGRAGETGGWEQPCGLLGKEVVVQCRDR